MTRVPEYEIETLRERIGESKTVVDGFAVEAGKVAEFAASLGDESAIHRDPKAAETAGHRAVPAPLTFVRASVFPHYRTDGNGKDPVFDLGFDPRYELHAEQAYDVERPVYVGDVLTGEATLTDVYQREGSDALLTFAVEELAYHDGTGSSVLTERMTFVEALPEEEA